MLNFNDIFKTKFIESVSSFSLCDTLIAMFIAFLLGLFITLIYKKTFNGVVFNESLNISLIGLCMLTTFVILAVTSNVVLSLGMVGALSIVRFRTAIKEPLDIVYLFWSIVVGIVVGAEMYPLAIIGSIFLGIVLIVFSNKKEKNSPYILVLNCNTSNAEKESLDIISKEIKKYKIKSKTISKNNIESTIEIKLPEKEKNETNFINKISKINGVNNVVLVSYNGDYMN